MASNTIKAKIVCETVEVRVTDTYGDVTTVTIPAYTRSVKDFNGTLNVHLGDYLAQASHPSIADFALYLVAKANEEPKEI